MSESLTDETDGGSKTKLKKSGKYQEAPFLRIVMN